MPGSLDNLIALLAAAVAVAGLSVGVIYLIRPRRIPPALSDQHLLVRVKVLLGRRRFGAAMMIAAAVMFLLGLCFMRNSDDATRQYFWALLLLLLLWLVVLALLDVIQISALRTDILRRSHQRIQQILNDSAADVETLRRQDDVKP